MSELGAGLHELDNSGSACIDADHLFKNASTYGHG